MIGVYDYTVIATYLSLLFGLAGIYSASRGNLFAAILFLVRAVMRDAFGARSARTKRTRTGTEKRFGIQIDSLNDLVCFGVLPAAIGTAMGCTAIWFLTTMAFFTLCALIRLAYFNVMEEERQEGTSEVRKFYLGVPVTSASFIVPAYYLLSLYGGLTDYIVYAIGLFVLGVAFIAPVRVTKPGLKGILFMGLLGIAELVLFLLSVPGK